MAGRWRAHPEVAWVEGPGRVALVDLRDPVAAVPQLCPEPAAELWRAVAEGPKGEDELVAVASGLVGDQAEGLVAAFLDGFGAAGLVVEVS